MSKQVCLVAWAVLVCLLVGATSAADPSLVAWWKLDDGSGATAVDSSGYGNHAALSGDFEWVEGKVGGGLHLDGTTAYGEIAPNSSMAVINQGDFSCVIWFKTDALDGVHQYMFQQGDLNGTGRSWLFLFTDDEIRTWVGGGPTGAGVFAEAEEWYHAGFVVTEEGATDSVQMYVNGEPAGDPNPMGMETCAGGFFIGSHKNLAAGSRWTGILDDLRVYERALTTEEIKTIMLGNPELAGDPSPLKDQVDVLRDVVLSWNPGQFAVTHDVYFGEVFDDVNNASAADPLSVLASAGQTDTTYAAGTLAFGQTYYWRIDEVNGAPDRTVFKGDVWSFEVEPFSIPVTNITATASSAHDGTMVPEKTIDGSGLDALDQHSNEPTDMWLSGMGDLAPSIQYEFDRAYKLHELWVWNSNQSIESFVGLGAKDVTIEVSTDGADWIQLEDVPPFAQASGQSGYAHNTTIDLGGVVAKYVKITINTGYGLLPQKGLSEVRFLYIPALAREPQPADGDTSDQVDVTLTWRAGREAVSHEVHLGTDPSALARAATVTDNSYAATDLDYATTFYWQIVEVNEAEDPAAYASPVWGFSTPAHGTIDDFEQYNDNCDRIFFAWADGLGHNGGEGVDNCDVAPSNGNGGGSIVGHAQSPFAERTIVHSGGQSLPLEYDNSFGPSEATLSFDRQDWTGHGIKSLSMFFRGDPANTGQLYIKINNTKVTYDGLPNALERPQWIPWNIDLSTVGGNLQSVTSLTIGVEGASASGMIYVDDIRLYPLAPEFVTPVEPDPANLVAHYAFDGNANDSVGGLHGTLVGNAAFETGQQGQALSLNTITVTDYVEITGYQGILGTSAMTVAAWVKTDSDATGAIVGWGPNVGGQRFGFRIDAGRLRHEHHGGNVQGDTVMNDGTWHHVALTIEANSTVSYPQVKLWLDGQDDTRPTTDPDVYDLTADLDVSIGRRPASDDRYFIGQIDELYIYDRVLSQAEIASLAGLTQRFDIPFE